MEDQYLSFFFEFITRHSIRTHQLNFKSHPFRLVTFVRLKPVNNFHILFFFNYSLMET